MAVELPGLHKSGKEISLELSFGEFQKDGRRFFTGIARDVTLRKQDEKRLAALQKVTDVALAHLSLDELLPESLNRIREALNVDTVAILLLRTEGDELVAWGAQGLQEEVEQGVRIPVGRGFAGRVLAQYRPIIIEDISQADVYSPLLREKGIKSLLGVPLFVEGRAIGVLHVGTLEFAHFTEDDLRLLQLAADRIALAIENARLYQVEKIARAEAEDANRAKDEFLTILSHELRTPLTPIIGWVQMMQTGILPNTEFNQALSVISRNAHSLKRLINDLLDMSAILSGKMRIDETLLSLADVLSESVDTMRPYAREANVDLQLEIAEGASALVIKGDRSRLSQIFCNILHNAIKFSPAGGYVQSVARPAIQQRLFASRIKAKAYRMSFYLMSLSAFGRQMVHALALTEDLVWDSRWLRASCKPTAGQLKQSAMAPAKVANLLSNYRAKPCPPERMAKKNRNSIWRKMQSAPAF